MNRRYSLLLVVALVVFGITAVPAFADAPDPIPSATHGTLVTNSDGSRTLTVWGGTNATSDPGWRWTTHGSDCNTDRAGAGVAVIWNDPNEQSNPITGKVGTYFIGTAADNVVHPTPQLVAGKVGANDVKTPNDYAGWRGGCGVYVNHPATVLPDGSTKSGNWSQGTWGPITHTYAASVKGPISVCPVMYDVHGHESGTAPNGAKEITAGGNGLNGDNSIQANGSTPQGNGCFTTTFGTPKLDVKKTSGEQSVAVGQTIHYTVTVTNTGDLDLTVSPSDTGCEGFDGSSFSLAVGQSRSLSCTHTATAADGKAYTNKACATGTDSSGGTASDCDEITTPIAKIAIDKTGPATADAGTKVEYTLTVTDPGSTSFAESQVQVTDPRCDGSPVTLSGKGGDGSPATLDPGDAWTYKCSAATSVDDTSVHNVATVVGKDTFGTTVQASDDADTTLTPPGQNVLGARIAPGTAKLQGPTGCVSKAFTSRVRGTKIATVTFVVDGKVIKRFTKPTASGVYAVRINPASLKLGVHRMVASITFRKGSATKPKSLRLSFQRCAKKLTQPRFTG